MKEKQRQTNKLQNACGDNRERIEWPSNAKWIVSLLAITIMMLLTWILTKKVVAGNVLLSALENFSTILSIVLSFSSIAFAGYTSIETGRQFNSMSRAVEEIRTSNRMMSDNYKILLEHYHDTVNSVLTSNKDNLSDNSVSSKVDVRKINNDIAIRNTSVANTESLNVQQ